MKIVALVMLLSTAGTCMASGGQGDTQAAIPMLKSFGAMAEQRASHSATLLPDGRVLIAGGFSKGDNAESYMSSAELFDPATRRFSGTGAMTYKRGGHTATLLASGMVLVAGGWSDMGVVSSAELYNPATGTFTTVPSMNVRRGGSTATLLKDGRVLICGGGDREITATAELFDPTTNRFTLTGSMTVPRYSHTATLLSDGQVLIAGGATKRNEVVSSTELYDPATGRFSPGEDMGAVRYKHAAVELSTGVILLLGGSDENDWRGTLALIERYNVASGKFIRVQDLKRPRFKLPAAVAPLADGSLLIAGGDRMIELLNPASGESKLVASLDSPYYYSTATALRDGSVLIAGGYDDRVRTTDRAWLYRP